MKEKNTHGGKREGAGRPKLKEPRTYKSIRVTEAEYEQVKIFLKKLKNNL